MLTKTRLVVPRPLGALVIGSVFSIVLLFLASCQTITTEGTEVTMPTGKMSGSILDSRLSHLQKESEEYPKKHTLHYEIAQVHYQKNDFRQSAKALHHAIELSPRIVKYHYHLGRVYLRMNELLLAREQFRAACGSMVSGRYTGPHAALGYTLAREGRLDEAIAEFENCVRIEPENPAFYYFLGSLYDIKLDEENVVWYYREYLARGGSKYKKRAILVLRSLGVEVETDSEVLTSVDESLFGSDPSAESSDSSD